MKVLIGGNQMGLENAIRDLREKYPGVEFVHCANRADTAQYIADADVYMGWMNRDIFVAAKNLKWVQSPSSGIDYYLAIPELVESDVLLSSARGTHGACLAESTLAMILAFTRGIRDAVLRQQDHLWAIREIRPKLVELTGSTLGIVGFGMVGRSLAERARVFGMRIVALDLYPTDKPDYVSELWGFDRLDDLLRQSDYLVVTVPRTPQTLGMIGAEQLALMKPTAMLVGISRGGIIDQDALAQALREKRLAAAALDVFMPEPLPEDSELWDVENLLITPHMAGGTQFEGQHVLDIFYENLGRFVRGELPLRNQIDKIRGF
ncbi:MAG: D-2-hydroxyacid dehydrogenase [Anaerolineae bacterium]|nr:D-2-hydroxyacid dehydrogenase [Anaerolineae bacterium]